jgi:hypothetical protein
MLRRDDAKIATYLGIAALPAVTAVAVAMWVDIPLTAYYPSKLLWHSTTLGLPALAFVAVTTWGQLWKGSASIALRVGARVAVTAGALLVLYGLTCPVAAFLGSWSTRRGPVVLAAVTTPRASAAQVVWLGTVGDDTIGRILLDFYRVGATPERTPQAPMDVLEECDLLRAAPRPTVLSDRSPADVRKRYLCVPDVTVISSSASR